MKERKLALKTKVLGLLMCLVLAIVVMPAEIVWAADATHTPTPLPVYDSTQNTTYPAITKATGSITIHKYTEGSEAGTTGTGSANDTPPTGAAALAGAQFKIYKVNDFDVTQFYSANPTPDTLPVATSYYTKEADGTIKIDTTKVTQKGDESEATGTDGKVEFTSLPLGLYLVEESKAPDGVTAPADPFLVCIPMTITTTDGGDVVNKWLYDVHVFPKNKTTAGITLFKQDAAGTGLGEFTFVLQKYDDTKSPVWQTITTNSSGDTLNLTTSNATGTLGKIEVEGLAAGRYRFIETDSGNNVGYIVDGVTAYEFTVNANGTTTYDTTTDKAVTINVVNEQPDIIKKVENRKVPESYEKAGDYSVGDTIKYEVDIEVPEKITSMREFKIVDTPTNLKDNNDVKITHSSGDLILGTHYTFTPNTPGNGFTVEFIESNLTNYAGKTLKLTYSAKLLDTAVTTNAGNPNTIKLIYDNKILPTDNSDGNPNKTQTEEPTPSTSTVEDGAIVFTFQIKVDKKDESGNALDGVVFDLYKEDADGTITDDTAEPFGLDKSKKWEKVASDLTTASGVVVKKGLEAGKYALVETKTATGYNLLAKAVEVELNADYTVTMKTTTDVTNRIIKKNDIATKQVTIDSTAVADGAEAEKTVSILNRKGFTLPTTGGAGGFLFTLVGCIIMIVGFIIFRKTKEKNTNNV